MMKQVCVCLTALLVCVWSAAAHAVNVSIDPAQLDLSELGTQFSVDIVVDDVDDLGAFQFDIAYDTAVLSITDNSSVSIGDLLGSTGRTVEVLSPVIDNDNGTVRIAAFSTGTDGGADGSGALAEVTFQLKAATAATLNLSGVILTDTAGASIPIGAVEDAQLLDLYRLSAVTAGTGTGTVTSNPAGISCGSVCGYDFEANDEIVLSASADNGSTFIGWDGGGCSGTGDCTVTLTADTQVTASFEGPCSLTLAPATARAPKLLPSVRLLRITGSGITFEKKVTTIAFDTEDIKLIGRRPLVRAEDSLIAPVLIKRGIAPGQYAVTVTTGDESCTLSDGFTIE